MARRFRWRFVTMTAEQRKSAAPRGAGERLLCLIKLIATQPRSFSLGELAERADLPASSIHRLLKILERNGFVERADARAYRPGRELHRQAPALQLGRDLRPGAVDDADRVPGGNELAHGAGRRSERGTAGLDDDEAHVR